MESIYEIINQSRYNDPVVFYTALIAVIGLLISLFTRRGGLDASFIIELFSAFATFGSIIKFIIGLVKSSAGVQSMPVTGTDIILLLGAFFAALVVVLEGIVNALQGKPEGLTFFGKLRAALTRKRQPETPIDPTPPPGQN